MAQGKFFKTYPQLSVNERRPIKLKYEAVEKFILTPLFLPIIP